MRTPILCLLSAGLTAGSFALLPGRSDPAVSPPTDPERILRTYVEDFRSDPAAGTPRTFGVRVTGDNGGAWLVTVHGRQDDDGRWRVDLDRREPADAAFVYTTDTATLARIDAGECSALTAAAKEFYGDSAPFDMQWSPGAERFDVNPLSFHFWTRGFPEKVRFGRELTREAHGAKNAIFYYEKGLRTVWSMLEKGDRVQNGPGQPMRVPFPVMVIAIRGACQGTVGGRPTTVAQGEMVFIPAMTPYEWWNEHDEPAEAILVMFGDGA